ncbi:unnamed protein product [Calypogeia fissa]
MVNAWHSVIALVGVWATSQALFGSPTAAEILTTDFYDQTCPSLFQIVETVVISSIQNDTRMAASLLRLHFHDCFVQGCDGSILLDAAGPTKPSEKDALPNRSLRGFDVIDTIKKAVESSCPNIVSCADIITLAAFFSVVQSKGPSWIVSLGRRDAFSANTNLTTNIAPPSFNVTQLQDNFAAQNLTTRDLVALLGAHTIGFSHCSSIHSRLYNFSGINGTADPTISRTLLTALEATCPSRVNFTVITSLDIQTPTLFDNLYFQNLLQGNGVLNSDEELVTTADDTNSWVNLYAADQSQFFNDFAAAIIKMGNLNVLTGTAGEIRQNCRARNPVSTISVEETSVTPIQRELSMARTMFMKMEARSSSKLWRTSNSNLYSSAMLRMTLYPQ